MRFILNRGLRLIAVLLFTLLIHEAISPRLFAPDEALTPVYQSADSEAVLRLHVVANSDTQEDQRVKLLVRDALLDQFAPMQSLEQAEAVLLNNGCGILETVQSVLSGENCQYGAQLRFGKMPFPDKSYGGTLYPAGVYEALRVELGDAEGENWWCVLFPPICLIDIGVNDIPQSDDIVFESDIWDFLTRDK